MERRVTLVVGQIRVHAFERERQLEHRRRAVPGHVTYGRLQWQTNNPRFSFAPKTHPITQIRVSARCFIPLDFPGANIADISSTCLTVT